MNGPVQLANLAALIADLYGQIVALQQENQTLKEQLDAATKQGTGE